MKNEDDTIAAIATPIGEGGISVIRISGKTAFETADRVFRGKTVLKAAQTHTAHFGCIVGSGEKRIDEVVATVYKTPHSYTAEDCIEISCHGGVLVTRKVLEAVLQAGARLAEPGEFTKRAFLNGRLDLSQAEAVADLIHSRSELSHKSSIQQLSGGLSRKINTIRDELIETSSLLELELDFAEEGIELSNKQEISGRIADVLTDLRGLIESFSCGKFYREGVKVVISGSPNVGKSSLLNALLNENRAIVTEIPGTTRDTIEENIIIDGVLFRLVDTAGLHNAGDIVEKEGVRRTEGQLASSDFVLLVFDLSQPIDNSDFELIRSIRNRITNFDERCMFVFNKLDLVSNSQANHLQFPNLGLDFDGRAVGVSALTHVGLDKLKKMLVGQVIYSKLTAPDLGVTVTNVRHKEALEKASEHLELSMKSLSQCRSPEFVSIDLRVALDYLGEIIGVVTTDDILNNIFAKFCIGK